MLSPLVRLLKRAKNVDGYKLLIHSLYTWEDCLILIRAVFLLRVLFTVKIVYIFNV